jgi:ATP-binding cassette subfamily B protein RaxB
VFESKARAAAFLPMEFLSVLKFHKTARQRSYLGWRQRGVRLQQSFSECGYVCAAAVFSLFGHLVSVDELKRKAGDASRGLTIRQLRDVLISFGAKTSAVMFDPSRAEAYPSPGIIILHGGHYVAIGKISHDLAEVFYPERGWTRVPIKRLARTANGIGVLVSGVDDDSLLAAVYPQKKLWSARSLGSSAVLKQLRSRLGVKTVVMSITAQLLALSIPLVSQRSIDAIGNRSSSNVFATISIAFLLISFLGNVAGIVSAYTNKILGKRMLLHSAGSVFDRLAAKTASWFDIRHASHVYNQIQICNEQVIYLNELTLAVIRVALTSLIGIAAVFFVSPWLMVPGLVCAILSIGVDWKFNQAMIQASSRLMTASQQHRMFVYDVVSQIPLLGRFGVLWVVRSRLRRKTRELGDATLQTAAIQSTASAFQSTLKTLEDLAFVCLAAFFMRTHLFTLGVFVAVGVYKDQLADSMKSAFQLVQRYRTLKPQRLEIHELIEGAPSSHPAAQAVIAGHVIAKKLSFRYAGLDALVLKDVSLEVKPREVVAFIGPSGAGKTTLLKLLSGVAVPENGNVSIDGMDVSGKMLAGVGIVLQSDRLISDSIRENIRLFNKDITDQDVYRALEMVDLKELVSSMPMRLDTHVGQEQAGLSGGQKQRLLLARAIVGSPRLLILDEATSSIDIEGEARILRKLAQTEATLIICSHRPEVWCHAHTVYRVKDGGIEKVQRAADEKRVVGQVARDAQ